MANPLMGEDMFTKTIEETPINGVMTMEGTINKSLTLIGLTILTAIGVWKYVDIFILYYLPIAIGAFVMAIGIIFFKKAAVYLASVYAILEGVLIGTISALFEQAYPGIVIQAVTLTFGVFIIMLTLYKYKIVKATEHFKSGIMSATGAIAGIYLISLIGHFSGWYSVPFIHESGLIGIIFSFVIVGIAALNLVLDFDNIEMGVKMRAPKYMEWYTAFSLLITLIWLYFEILKLLSKMRSR